MANHAPGFLALVNDAKTPMPQPLAKLLEETSFVRLDRRALFAGKIDHSAP